MIIKFEKLNIYSILLSVGLENDILEILSMFSKFWVKLYVQETLCSFLPTLIKHYAPSYSR